MDLLRGVGEDESLDLTGRQAPSFAFRSDRLAGIPVGHEEGPLVRWLLMS
jgi:hypothetical protein